MTYNNESDVDIPCYLRKMTNGLDPEGIKKILLFGRESDPSNN